MENLELTAVSKLHSNSSFYILNLKDLCKKYNL